jgi:hypothetical protein
MSPAALQLLLVVGTKACKHVFGRYVGPRVRQRGEDFLAHDFVHRGLLTVERAKRSTNDLVG